MLILLGVLKPFWTGALVIDQVVIPVGLVPAARNGAAQLTRIHAGCGARVESKAWCPRHERELADEEIARGYEIAPGQYAEISDADLEATKPVDTRTIDVQCAIARARVDRLQTDATYLLTPSEAPIGRRPYELVRQVLADSDDVMLICRLTVRGNEWVAAVSAHPERKLLILEKLHPAGDIADTKQAEKQLAGVKVTDGELTLCRELVFGRIRSRMPKTDLPQRDRVRRVVDAAIAGKPLTIEKPTGGVQQTLPSDDLEATLRNSIRGRGSAKPKSRPRAATAKR